MANQKAVEMALGVPGAVATIWYNDVNQRIGNIELSVPPGWEAAARIWDNDVLVYYQAYLPGSYSESVPGNYRMEYVTDPTDPDGGYYDLPSNIKWSVSFQSTSVF